jgi:16S rRNA (guanine527-N7)-methyltransferase
MQSSRSDALTEFAADALYAEARRAGLEPLGLDLDGEALARFARYFELLRDWNERAGLTTVTEPTRVAQRHFGESIALLAVLRRAGLLLEAARVIDVGSGAGFPGLPMAIVDRSLQVTLLESNARRADFLRTATTALGLTEVEVVQARAEDAGRNGDLREHFDVAVARALAPLNVLVELALPLVTSSGLLATPKGERATDELADAASAIAALGAQAEEPLALPLPEGVPAQLVLVVRRDGELDPRYPRRAGIPSKRPL